MVMAVMMARHRNSSARGAVRIVHAVLSSAALLLYLHSVGARKAETTKEAERLAEAVREHGVAGRWPQSIEASLQAIASDPTSSILYSDLSFSLTQVAVQPAATQQQIAQRLAEAVSGEDDRMPFVPEVAALYEAVPFRHRALAIAKQGATVGCSGGNFPGGFAAGLETSSPAEQAEFGWLSAAMDVLSQSSGTSVSNLQGCTSGISRLAASADGTDPIVSYAAGRLALAFADKFGRTPGFPDLFNCGKNGIQVTLAVGGADQRYLAGDGEKFHRVVFPVSLLAADVKVDSVDSLELARALFLGEEQGSANGQGVLTTLSLRSKLVQVGAKTCLDRAVRLQPQNTLGYYARGSLMANLAGSSGAGTAHGLADYRMYLALDPADKTADAHTIAFRAAILTERLVNRMISEKLSLPDALDTADGDLADLFSVNASVHVNGAERALITARSRLIVNDAGAWQSLRGLSQADLMSTFNEYASRLSRRSAADPRPNVLLATKVLLAAKLKEASGTELSSSAKARAYRNVNDLVDKALASVEALRATQQQAAVHDSEYRAWALKAEAGLRYGGMDLATHVYSPSSLRTDRKTWSFTPSATCRAYEVAAERAASAFEAGLVVKDAAVMYFANAARLMWLHKLIVPRGYNGWIGDQTPPQLEIVAKDITTPPHQTEQWKRVSRNYEKALQLEPTNVESFLGKLMVDGEWLERWLRFHAPAPGAVPPAEDEDGPLPAGAYLSGDALKRKVSEFYEAFRHTAAAGSDHYQASSLRFVHEKAWTRPTNQPIDMLAVEEAIVHAPRAGLVLEFGVFEATTIRDLSLYMEQRHNEMLATDAATPPPFLLNDIHGFDSFEGLPHDWHGRSGMKAGHFSLNGVIPPVFIECVYIIRALLFALSRGCTERIVCVCVGRSCVLLPKRIVR